MTSNGGLLNPAYHDSETLEIHQRSSSGSCHINPYAREGPALPGERAEGRDGAALGAPWAGWEDASRRVGENVPMGRVTPSPGSPSWQHDLTNMTKRWRGISMRRMSMFPEAHPAHAAFTEVAIRSEMENEEQQLVKELVALSTREQIQAIRDLPMSFEAKKHIRSQVQAFMSYQRSRQFTCLTECSEHLALSLRRCGYSVRSAWQSLELWHGIMKEIGGRFGSSVLTYFVFLKWLLMFNLFSFLINFGFITIPLLVYDPSPNTPSDVRFRGLELLTGAGYFNNTVMYYGGYSNETLSGLVEYDMQLAYFFTIAAYMVLCGILLIFSMASSFRKNFVPADPASHGAWQLLCSWDFSVTNEKAVRQRKSNLGIQLKESLSEKAQRELLTRSQRLRHFGVQLGAWFLSTSLAVGCGVAIFYLCLYEKTRTSDSAGWSLLQEAQTLLVPFVVSLINLVIPLFFSLFNNFEHYSSQRRQIYALVLRNVLLKMSILGVLCYYWMNMMPQNFSVRLFN